MKKKLTTQGFKKLKQPPQPAAPAADSPAGIPLFLRSKAEASLGRSLHDVRVHTDDESARSLGARAYTTGRDIVFAPGQYNPQSPEGQRLLAHELAHVVQQSGGETVPALGPAGDAHEQSADRAAGNVMAGTAAGIAPASGAPAVQREPDKSAAPTRGSETVDAFPTGSASLNDAQKARVAAAAASILALRADHSSTSVTVTGHTDAVGGEAFNDILGQVRADAVKGELIAQGVPGESITATTAGSHQPKVPTNTAEPRNRRAEIQFESVSRPAPKKAEEPKPEETKPEPKPALPPPLRPLSTALETGRKIFAPIPPDPRTAPKTPGKPLLDTIDKAMDSVLERLGIPAPLRPIVKSGAKAAAVKAATAPLDAAMDQAHLNDTDKKAVHAAFQSAIDIALP
jgi:outer membrane protein OmpA-like peptidoglycan-associated protein